MNPPSSSTAKAQNPTLIFLIFPALLGTLVVATRVLEHQALVSSFFASITFLIVGYGSLRLFSRDELSYEMVIRRPHLVQACVQTGVFVYWGSAWSQVALQAPLIIAQIFFAFGCDALVSWRRYGHWRLGLGPIPVVLSTNLFLWFVDDYFVLQFAMIALAYLSRDLLVAHVDGERRHIFNPSAFALAIAAVGLVVFRVPELTHGADIAQTLGDPEYPYIWIFLMGIIVQGFFGVTMVTLAAALSLFFWGQSYFAWFGTYYYLDTSIPIAVFLGMNLLITDPASSPKSLTGRMIFGALYGSLVFVSYDILRGLESPSQLTQLPMNISWLDKLLCVPVLNCLARPIDRLVARFEEDAARPRWYSQNRTYMVVWMLAFLSILPSLTDHPGRNLSVWETACEGGLRRACEDRSRLYWTRCESGQAEACYNYGQDFQNGTEVEKNLQFALAGYRRACMGQLETGCLAVAGLCSSDRSLCDAEELEISLQMACEYKSPTGCAQMVRYALEKDAAGVLSSPLQMTLEARCVRGEYAACAGVNVFALAYLRPGETQDLKRAHRTLEAACAHRYTDACLNLSLMELKGDGVPQNVMGAKLRLAMMCQNQSPRACAILNQFKNAE